MMRGLRVADNIRRNNALLNEHILGPQRQSDCSDELNVVLDVKTAEVRRLHFHNALGQHGVSNAETADDRRMVNKVSEVLSVWGRSCHLYFIIVRVDSVVDV